MYSHILFISTCIGEVFLRFKIKDFDLSYSQWEHLIDEHIFDEQYRKILKRKLLDNITFENLAEESKMSTRQIQYIVHDGLQELIRHI